MLHDSLQSRNAFRQVLPCLPPGLKSSAQPPAVAQVQPPAVALAILAACASYPAGDAESGAARRWGTARRTVDVRHMWGVQIDWSTDQTQNLGRICFIGFGL